MTGSWGGLSAEIAGCTACSDLAQSRQRVVVGEWAATARRPELAFVGEAPGADEDAAGRPFVGKAGELLDQLLHDAALDRLQAAVLNVLKCRPVATVPLLSAAPLRRRLGPGPRTGNRAPREDEVARCRPYLERQLVLLRPRLVVALGSTAAAWFLGRRTTLAAARGRAHEVIIAGMPMRVLPTYHPSAAIRFGPSGAPMAALRDDLALAAKLLAGA